MSMSYSTSEIKINCSVILYRSGNLKGKIRAFLLIGLCVIPFTYPILSGCSHSGYLHAPLKNIDLGHHPMESGLRIRSKVKPTCQFNQSQTNKIKHIFKHGTQSPDSTTPLCLTAPNVVPPEVQ